MHYGGGFEYQRKARTDALPIRTQLSVNGSILPPLVKLA